MSTQAVDFFRPWNNNNESSDRKEISSTREETRTNEEKMKSKTSEQSRIEEDFDSESDDSSLAGSSASYNSIDSEQSLIENSRRAKKSKNVTVTTPTSICSQSIIPNVYHPHHHHHPVYCADQQQQSIWEPLNTVRFEDAVYLNGIAAEVDRIHQQEYVAKQIKKTRPKNFNCNYCPAAFSNNGQLKGHLRTHTGEKPFRCNAEGCSRAFTRNEELTRHKRIHTGLKPFVCDLCQKKFGRKDHLKKHYKTHNRYANPADYDFAYMASVISGHYYGYYPTNVSPTAVANPFGSFFPVE